jgi:hypothetical protein
MGWIGWTWDQTQDAPLHAIHVAYTGRLKMLHAIFGGDDPTKPKPPEKPRLSLVRQFAELKKQYDKQKGG